MDQRSHQTIARFFLTVIVMLAWVLLALFLPWDKADDQARAFFVFLAVLPLLNALFDTLSYALTLTLMRLGLAGRHPFVLGLLDLAAALILFLALGAVLIAALSGLNRLAGVALVDLEGIFTGIKAAPYDYLWLYAMMFSTILPTALHFFLSALGLQSFTPHLLRRPVAAWLDGADRDVWKAVVAPLATSLIWLWPLLLIGAGAWGLWLVIGDWSAAIGWIYFDLLRAFAGYLS